VSNVRESGETYGNSELPSPSERAPSAEGDGEVTRVDDSSVPDYTAWSRLDGKTFVVLGAGQGIGRQTAHAARAAGAFVVCVDRDADLADDAAGEVEGLSVAADVTKRADVQRVFDTTVGLRGRVDGAIDIVGIGRADDILELTDETWDEVFDICLRHVFLTMQIGARTMIPTGGGALAFVSSMSGLNSAPRHAAYGAAKAALNSLVRTAAVEFGPLGIRVNAVAPGPTSTPRLSARLAQGGLQAWIDAQPTGRLSSPADIAASLLFLTSPQSANITGQILVVDGGVTSRYAFDDGVPKATVTELARASDSAAGLA
jgi:NAD(P)-dependent dehydrogenase (short-subunit alcohol dehydrogenase family)